MTDDLARALADLKEKEAMEIARRRLESGEEPLVILEDARRGLEIVGERFQKGEYFIPDLIYSGEILNGISAVVKPNITKTDTGKRAGEVILGTVAGDIHDIGKNIVAFMLDISGFRVYDLGVDVPPKKFVDAINETGAAVVGLSGLLSLAFDSMKETVEAIKAAGLRDRVKIMIGGGIMDDQIRKYARADAYGRDAAEAVTLARKWVGGK